MKKYCKTYFKAYNIFHLDDFLSSIEVKPEKIIKCNDESYELHFCYYDKYENDLEPMYFETIKNLIPYLDTLVEWKEKGEKVVLVRLEISFNGGYKY